MDDRAPDKPPYIPRVSPETLSLVSRCLSQGAFGDGITIPEHSGHVSADLGVRPQATPGASIPHIRLQRGAVPPCCCQTEKPFLIVHRAVYCNL